jgi:hypothetical protein
MCTNNAQLSTGPEFPWKIIPDPYQCLFFLAKFRHFFTKKLKRFWIFFSSVNSNNFFPFYEKKKPNFDIKNSKEEVLILVWYKESVYFIFVLRNEPLWFHLRGDEEPTLYGSAVFCWGTNFMHKAASYIHQKILLILYKYNGPMEEVPHAAWPRAFPGPVPKSGMGQLSKGPFLPSLLQMPPLLPQKLNFVKSMVQLSSDWWQLLISYP